MSSEYYSVESVQETGWEPDAHNNNWFSVKFSGVADNALWLAKNRPDVGAKVYGHIERTQSGKGWRFKRDQVPEGETPESPAQSPVEAFGVINNNLFAPIQPQLDRIEAMVKKLLGTEEPELDTVHPVVEGEPISLDEMPEDFLT